MAMGWPDAFAFVRADARIRKDAARLSLLITRAAGFEQKDFKAMLSALE